VNERLTGQSLYIDSNTLIYATETPGLFPGLMQGLILPLSLGQLKAVTSWLTLAEVLVRPLQIGDSDLVAVYREFLTPSASLTIAPVDGDIAAEASRIRSQFGLKLPDAIHVATGILNGCTSFVTADQQWRKVGVHVVDPSAV